MSAWEEGTPLYGGHGRVVGGVGAQEHSGLRQPAYWSWQKLFNTKTKVTKQQGNDKHVGRISSFLISDLVDGELELELTRPLDWI